MFKCDIEVPVKKGKAMVSILQHHLDKLIIVQLAVPILTRRVFTKNATTTFRIVKEYKYIFDQVESLELAPLLLLLFLYLAHLDSSFLDF